MGNMVRIRSFGLFFFWLQTRRVGSRMDSEAKGQELSKVTDIMLVLELVTRELC